MSTFQNIRACVFDAYGTLFDVSSALESSRKRLGAQADTLSVLWRAKQLEYTWLRSLMRRYADFWQVTQDALDYALDSLGMNDGALRRELMEAYLHLNCYPDAPEALRALKQAGLKTAILSNGTPAMLKAAVENSGLAGLVDVVLSVEEVGVFKPDPRVYQLAVERLGVSAHEISFQSSNAWDAAGAASFGFRVAWINRLAQPPEQLPFGPDVELTSLAELPNLLGCGARRRDPERKDEEPDK